MKLIIIILVGLLSAGFAVMKAGQFIDRGSWRAPHTAQAFPGQVQRDELSGSGARTSSAACMSAEEVSNALQTFTSEDMSAMDQAEALLREKSRESEQCRVEVITALMKAMDRPNLDLTRDKESYYLWLYGAELLGELKASEALDLLVSHLHLMDRNFYSSSMAHRPALKGVVKMGPIAIPKLDAVMRHSPDPQPRFDAVYCIATIGGPSAVHSLREAIDSESDECVSRAIRVSLESFDADGKIKDRMDWFFRLTCKK